MITYSLIHFRKKNKMKRFAFFCSSIPLLFFATVYGFLFLLAFTGCGTATPYNHPTIVAYNKQKLAGPGEEVGILPDGRKLVRYSIHMGSDEFGVTEHHHWVYVVENSNSKPTSITINREIQTSFNHVEVIIDGISYKPVEKE